MDRFVREADDDRRLCIVVPILVPIVVESALSGLAENACRIGTLELKKTGPVNLRLQAVKICPDRAEGLAVTELKLVPVIEA